CRRLLNLGRSLGDEPMMTSQSVRLRTARTAVRGAQRLLAQGEPAAAGLADLQRRFAEEANHPRFLTGLRGERAGPDGLMALIQSGELSWQWAWFLEREEQTGKDTYEALLLSLTPGAEKESRAIVLRQMTDLIEIAQLPDEAQGPAFDRAEARRKE